MNIFHIPVINILWQIVAGERYDYEDVQLVEITKKVTSLTRVQLFQPNAATFLPILGKLFPKIDQPASYKAIWDIKLYVEELVQKHRDTFDPDNIRDFIDMYLLRVQQEQREESTFHPKRGYEEIACIVTDLFLAGMDTTAITLQFAIIFMVNNQEVQLKARQEIFEVLGSEREPALGDKSKMPYCEATVMEIQRKADISPDGVPHYSRTQIDVGSHVIPQGHGQSYRNRDFLILIYSFLVIFGVLLNFVLIFNQGERAKRASRRYRGGSGGTGQMASRGRA